ncbi:hypothetical protein [Arvimicrobium flavum]|uniref:hypothetical protein n=1 Tax=Arvimicrobium flavum TaxID=3393320 RepID=UPI00237AAEEC|nr:hypothetical protein [Mesorhizobium shangrilense]
MALTIFDEFNVKALSPQALATLVARQATTRSYAVQKNEADNIRRRDDERRRREEGQDAEDIVFLMAAVYHETQMRMIARFDEDAEASRLAMAKIDKRLAELEQERLAMVERAVKLPDGRAVFLSEDGKSIFTEDGEKLPEAEAERLLEERGDELRAGYSSERWKAVGDERGALVAEKAALAEWDAYREELKARVAGGEMTQDELEEAERDYEESVPETVKEMRAKRDAAELLSEKQTATRDDGIAKQAHAAPADDAIDLTGTSVEREAPAAGAPRGVPKFGM